MLTRYFDEPVEVLYRTSTHWQPVLALAVRRSGQRHEVLIKFTASIGGVTHDIWVSRDHIRPSNPQTRLDTPR